MFSLCVYADVFTCTCVYIAGVCLVDEGYLIISIGGSLMRGPSCVNTNDIVVVDPFSS